MADMYVDELQVKGKSYGIHDTNARDSISDIETRLNVLSTRLTTEKDSRESDVANLQSTKADKTVTMNNLIYNTDDGIFIKKINDEVSNVVSVATLKADMALNNVDNTSDATIYSNVDTKINNAINSLDVANTNVGADSTLATISETDGKIATTTQKITITESQVTNLNADLATKADKSTTTTAGTYKSVTVNAQGIITGGSNPTTLSGYGITDAYTKTDIDGKVKTINDTVATKANASDVYTKSEHNASVAAEIAKVIADAPESLNTLKEIADWINNHPNQVSALNTAIAANKTAIETEVTNRTTAVNAKYTKPSKGIPKTDLASAVQTSLGKADTAIQDISGKVDKVSGKGLSTNDYTTAEKNKLAGIAANANNYSLPTATSSVLGGVKTSTGISNSSGTISVSYGTTAGTACQGNDSRLSNARNAADVYAWAKQSSASFNSTYPLSINGYTISIS